MCARILDEVSSIACVAACLVGETIAPLRPSPALRSNVAMISLLRYLSPASRKDQLRENRQFTKSSPKACTSVISVLVFFFLAHNSK